VAGHQPPPRPSAPREPPVGPLRPMAPREPPARPLRPPATPATLQPSAAGPRRSKSQERSPVSIGRLKCFANKNNDKIYQTKQ
jgi:hypothetical protein